MTSEKQGRLSTEEGEAAVGLLCEDYRYEKRPGRSKLQVALYWTFGLSGLLLYTVLVVVVHRRTSFQFYHPPSIVVPNIAKDHIRYVPTTYGDSDMVDHPYFGEPTDELDAKWSTLLQYSDIRVPEEEVARLGRENEAVHFPDGGYFGMMTVHHDLHCLMRFHHHMHLDRYFPNMTDEERVLEQRHTVHCLDRVKSSIMCNADSTILTMRWLDFTNLPSANWTTPHSCVDWDLLNTYAREHYVDTRQDGMMIHPKLGPLFHNGKNIDKNNRIGVASMPHDRERF